MKKLPLALGALTLAMFFSCTKDIQQDATTNDVAGSAANSNAVAENASDPFVPNEILVKFKAGTSEDAKNKAFSRISAKVKDKILTKAMKHFGDNEGVYLVNTPIDVLEAIGKVRGLEIEFAEPNFIYTHDAESNDTYYTNGSLWGMYGDNSAVSPNTAINQYGSQAEEAWAGGNTGSSSVYVGVIDEGVMNTHEDIAPNFAFGYDFVNNDDNTFDGVGDDHGTHVAGTIGAVGGNAKGVAGVNWNVKIISAKFLGATGGTTANAIRAVDYITNLKTEQGLNIVATNNSWGGGGFSQGLQDAITRAGNANILFIAAAGNDGLNTENNTSYPSGYSNDNIIAVASITSTGAISSFSNYATSKVDIGAPGSGIWSTVPGSSGKGRRATFTSTYASYSGTSMATPHVTGGAALYAASHPGSTAAQIKNAILSSAVFTSSLNGKCVTNGRLNVSGF